MNITKTQFIQVLDSVGAAYDYTAPLTKRVTSLAVWLYVNQINLPLVREYLLELDDKGFVEFDKFQQPTN